MQTDSKIARQQDSQIDRPKNNCWMDITSDIQTKQYVWVCVYASGYLFSNDN